MTSAAVTATGSSGIDGGAEKPIAGLPLRPIAENDMRRSCPDEISPGDGAVQLKLRRPRGFSFSVDPAWGGTRKILPVFIPGRGAVASSAKFTIPLPGFPTGICGTFPLRLPVGDGYGQMVSCFPVLPFDRRLSRSDQIIVGFAEMLVSEESPVGRERGGMSRFQHQIAGRIDKCAFLLRI